LTDLPACIVPKMMMESCRLAYDDYF